MHKDKKRFIMGSQSIFVTFIMKQSFLFNPFRRTVSNISFINLYYIDLLTRAYITLSISILHKVTKHYSDYYPNNHCLNNNVNFFEGI